MQKPPQSPMLLTQRENKKYCHHELPEVSGQLIEGQMFFLIIKKVFDRLRLIVMTFAN